MTVDRNTHSMRVSPALFELTTDCLRHCSNARLHFASLGDLIADAAAIACDMVRDDPASLADHLATMPADGPIDLAFTLTSDEQKAFTAFRQHAAGLARAPANDSEALSMLLFAYLVDRHANAVKAALAASAPDASATTGPAAPDTVVPFRR